jgi:hypothetical protein
LVVPRSIPITLLIAAWPPGPGFLPVDATDEWIIGV